MYLGNKWAEREMKGLASSKLPWEGVTQPGDMPAVRTDP